MERLSTSGLRRLAIIIASIGATATVASTMSTGQRVVHGDLPYSVRVYDVADLAVWKRDAQGDLVFAPQVLASHIQATISPETWEEDIRPSAENASFIISQTDANHERVARLLHELRAGEPAETQQR